MATKYQTREEIIDFIFRRACDKIQSAGCTIVDRIAKFHFDLLEDLDATDKAKELYEYYQQHA